MAQEDDSCSEGQTEFLKISGSLPDKLNIEQMNQPRYLSYI